MSFAHSAIVALGAVLALVATQVGAGTGLAQGDASGDVTLTLTVDSAETAFGVGDTGKAGLSKGDTYVSNGILRDPAGQPVGTYHVACTITNELDKNGSAWSLCSTAAVIDGQGSLLASGITELFRYDTSSNGFGVAPPKAEFAVVGGTGSFAGAIGQATSTLDASRRTLEYRFHLSGISPPAQVPSE